MRRLKKLLILYLSVFVANVVFTASPKSWDTFNLEPLSIIYPEEESLSNPPFIHWQDVKNAHHYKIKMASSQKTYRWTTPFNFYTPEKPLPIGFYTVEVSAYDKSNKEIILAKSKNFKISKEGYDLGLSVNDVTFEVGKPIIFSPEIIKEIKALTGKEAEYKEKLIAIANQPLPEILKDFKEPERYKDYIWNFDVWKKNNSLCFEIENYILAQTLSYALTNDKKYSENAKNMMLKICEWAPTGSTGAWENDHSAQAFLHALAIGYNTLKNELSADEKEKIAKAIRLRSEDMYHFLNPFVMKETSAGPMNDPDNNHPWFCTSALGFGGLALMGEEPKANAWLSFVTQMFLGVYFPRGGIKGDWHEGIDYWSYNLFFVFQFCDALKTASGINLYKYPWLMNTAFFKIYVHPPKGGYVPFGDCKQHSPNSFDKIIMMRLASEYNDPLAWKYVDAIPEAIEQSRYLFYAVLWSNRKIEQSQSEKEIPFAFHFEDSGWAVSNNNIFDPSKQIIFAFRSGRFFGRSFGHSHADQNSFIITAGGDKLIWDAGYYDSYLSPHHRNYSRLSIAHNTILVDGAGQVVHTKGIDGKITKFELNGKSLLVQGDASIPLVYGGKIVKFIRTIEYKDEREFIIKDDIMAKELSQISFLLHSAYPIIYNTGDKSILIKGEHYQMYGRFETSVPVEAIIRDRFQVVPNKPSNVLSERDTMPEQYHLELKTVDKIETWTPCLSLSLSPIMK